MKSLNFEMRKWGAEESNKKNRVHEILDEQVG